MTRLQTLRQTVTKLYEQQLPGRDHWADWLFPNHVLVVTNFAKDLAEKYQVNSELAQVAALLHDIADYKMMRSNPVHEEESLKIVRQLMAEAGYSKEEIEMTVDELVEDAGRPQEFVDADVDVLGVA